jgi:hypothetical protein
MGTRNLTAVFYKGEFKIAQYGQWDGYPAGQGATALDFLRSKGNRARLRAKLADCVYVTEEEMQAALKKLGIGEWMTSEESDRFHAEFPFIDRDHGANILRLVAGSRSKTIRLQDSLSFAADSLFCEWAYVVDFDTNSLEVYRGFNTQGRPRGGRFSKLPLEKKSASGNQYFPIRLVRKFTLSRLPSKANFLKALEGKGR